MSRSTPSLLALLGLVAVAGYQNRTRISEMLSDARSSARSSANLPGQMPPQPGAGPSGTGGFLSELGQFFQTNPMGQNSTGQSVASGLGDLVDRFKSAGQGAVAESWVSSAANHPVDVDTLAAALGPETLAELGQKTGLSRAELLLRLNAALPDVVNQLTPNGRLPTDEEGRGVY